MAPKKHACPRCGEWTTERYCEACQEADRLAQDADREMGIEEATDPLTGWKD